MIRLATILVIYCLRKWRNGYWNVCASLTALRDWVGMNLLYCCRLLKRGQMPYRLQKKSAMH